MSIVGHGTVRQLLEQELPPVVLLLGPASVGKETLALHLAEHHQVHPADRIGLEQLRLDDVRDTIARFVSTAPFGAFKLVLFSLDGATGHAQQALLKLLEEPPPRARFLMWASSPPLPTVQSRCRIFHCGLLHDGEIRRILLGQGFTAKAAERAGALGIGRVQPTIDAIKQEQQIDTVLSLAKAIGMHDMQLFDRTIRQWNSRVHELFLIWVAENLTGQWRHFTAEHAYGADPVVLTQMLVALHRTRWARSRLAVRTALMPFITRS